MPVQVDLDAGIAHVRLDRPEKRNGLDLEMFRSLIAAGHRVAADPSVRAVVLSGEGPVFCAGLDVQSVFMGGAQAVADLLDVRTGITNLAQEAVWVWREVPAPVIAAIHGVAYGGGLQIAMGADIRLIAPDATMCVMEIVWGLIPDMGISKTALPQVRPDVLKELMLTGRKVAGPEAVALGLATRVCDDPKAAALAMAAEIAAKNPHAVRRCKQLVDRAPGLSTADAFLLETELQRPLLGSPNQLEAMTARWQKRAPVFADPED